MYNMCTNCKTLTYGKFCHKCGTEIDVQEQIKLNAAKLAKSTKAADAKKLRVARIDTWARANLEVGMFVRVNGTRHGVGLRKILSIHSWGFSGQIYRAGRKIPNGFSVPPKPDNYITEHMFNKLQSVLIDDIWVNIAKLTKETE